MNAVTVFIVIVGSSMAVLGWPIESTHDWRATQPLTLNMDGTAARSLYAPPSPPAYSPPPVSYTPPKPVSYAPASSYGSAVGVFPNAKVGGCSIPILLSCSPNVVHGHIVKSQGYSAPAYRTIDEETPDFDFMQARAASHHMASEDLPTASQDSHHAATHVVQQQAISEPLANLAPAQLAEATIPAKL